MVLEKQQDHKLLAANYQDLMSARIVGRSNSYTRGIRRHGQPSTTPLGR